MTSDEQKKQFEPLEIDPATEQFIETRRFTDRQIMEAMMLLRGPVGDALRAHDEARRREHEAGQ